MKTNLLFTNLRNMLFIYYKEFYASNDECGDQSRS